jgi:hypothetical protein
MPFLDFLKEGVDLMVKEVAELREWTSVQTGEEGARAELIQRLEERIAKFHVHLALYLEWQCVMGVTFTETYLQDALVHFAGLDSDLMEESGQQASYADILSAATLEELAVEMRVRWARNFVDGGGPTKWLQRLQKMGASNLRDFKIEPMEELWGIRHLIIHRAGKVSRDFQRRHPRFSLSVGEHIKLSHEMLAVYFEAIAKFVVETESFLLKRHVARHPSI